MAEQQPKVELTKITKCSNPPIPPFPPSAPPKNMSYHIKRSPDGPKTKQINQKLPIRSRVDIRLKRLTVQVTLDIG